ncbi:MAG: PqqD family peptide modification chaperone [Armatimonadetes bacterium]|nr:PqqD family peptide modification chaperone [Armatimonadota bacterium]NIM23877.1 PqqD family peptide modification chaperone [Armatimonadota bacterium]NIM67756.1 PqqD family peptide modification chaperone [Armatimonadota bacterium]NIM76265.1 PqqD family peptide modification chaperone [Armatimonadota bacterium]NIN05958.1 PqqD family peptide modification chaperone [Armatimonadota bacterium]
MSANQEKIAVKMQKGKPRLTRRQALSALPVRNQAFAVRRTENGETEITVPRRNDWLGKLLSLILLIPKERKIVLEAVGSEVWDMCDGAHTVSQMADALVKKHKLDRREAETSLTEYLRRLGKRRLIAFAIPKTALERKSSAAGRDRTA